MDAVDGRFCPVQVRVEPLHVARATEREVEEKQEQEEEELDVCAVQKTARLLLTQSMSLSSRGLPRESSKAFPSGGFFRGIPESWCNTVKARVRVAQHQKKGKEKSNVCTRPLGRPIPKTRDRYIAASFTGDASPFDSLMG